MRRSLIGSVLGLIAWMLQVNAGFMNLTPYPPSIYSKGVSSAVTASGMSLHRMAVDQSYYHMQTADDRSQYLQLPRFMLSADGWMRPRLPTASFSSTTTPCTSCSSTTTPSTDYSSTYTPSTSCSSTTTPGTDCSSTYKPSTFCSSTITPGADCSSTSKPDTECSTTATPGTECSPTTTARLPSKQEVWSFPEFIIQLRSTTPTDGSSTTASTETQTTPPPTTSTQSTLPTRCTDTPLPSTPCTDHSPSSNLCTDCTPSSTTPETQRPCRDNCSKLLSSSGCRCQCHRLLNESRSSLPENARSRESERFRHQPLSRTTPIYSATPTLPREYNKLDFWHRK